MHTMNIPQWKDFLNHIAVRHGQPVMSWGPPGCGKTEATYQICRDENYFQCDVRLGQYDSVDMRGFPGAEFLAEGDTHKRTVWHAPSTLPFKANADLFPRDRVVLLTLDEVNSASQPVFAVAMQLINERRIGEHELLPNVRICAMGNREGDRGVANRMPTTVANRLTHVEVMPDVDAYCEYRAGKGCAPEEIAFYQFRKELLNTFDPNSPEKAFATPRTSERAWTFYADKSMPELVKEAAMAGAVGDGVAAEAWGFIKIWQNLTPIKEIIARPLDVPIPNEASVQYALSVSVSGALTRGTAKPLCAFLDRMAPEFTVLAWQLAIKRDREMFDTSEYLDFAKTYQNLFANRNA